MFAASNHTTRASHTASVKIATYSTTSVFVASLGFDTFLGVQYHHIGSTAPWYRKDSVSPKSRYCSYTMLRRERLMNGKCIILDHNLRRRAETFVAIGKSTATAAPFVGASVAFCPRVPVKRHWTAVHCQSCVSVCMLNKKRKGAKHRDKDELRSWAFLPSGICAHDKDGVLFARLAMRKTKQRAFGRSQCGCRC